MTSTVSARKLLERKQHFERMEFKGFGSLSKMSDFLEQRGLHDVASIFREKEDERLGQLEYCRHEDEVKCSGAALNEYVVKRCAPVRAILQPHADESHRKRLKRMRRELWKKPHWQRSDEERAISQRSHSLRASAEGLALPLS